MESRENPKLGQLSEAYEIIGEISGRTDARAFLARRKADDAELLVRVAKKPEGDEGNALNHLAADSNLLKGQRHRALVPIVDAQWVDDNFAIVTERPNGAPLEELLARREEEFDYPRIAMVLQELNGLLEWAREQKVVHRALGTDSVFLEPGSDRVMAWFEVRPLPIADMPGPEEDAKTIARLARTMLTRSPMDPERESQPLDELRPGLPASVVAQTEVFLNGAVTDLPDVKAYIASIAMADALKHGETVCANTIAQLREDERVAREKIEAERNACVLASQEQQQAFEKERAEIAKERERDQAALAKEREREYAAFEKERDKERAALKREREAIMAELAKERQSLLKVRDALERERSELVKRAAELEKHRELYARTQQFETPPAGDAVIPALPAMAALPEIPELKVKAEPPRRVLPLRSRPVRERSWIPRGRRALMIGAGAVALLLVIALAGTLGRRPTRAATPTRASAGPLIDSAAGVSVAKAADSLTDLTVGDSTATLGTIGIPSDFVSGVASRAAFDPPPVARRPRPRRVETLAPRPDTMRRDSLIRSDTTFGPGALVVPIRPDSLGRSDTTRRDTVVRRDTLPRRDTLVRRDTARPRDTLVRRDTLPRP